MRCPPKRTIPAAGFTLIELLVVIGIIAVLISILLPTLAAAREQALTIKCLSNLRQMAQAAQMYCNDNDGAFPLADFGGSSAGLAVNTNWDFTVTTDTTSGARTVAAGLLWAGQADLEVQQCPSFDGNSASLMDPFTGYNYNTSFIGGGQYGLLIAPSARISQVLYPTRCVLFGDGQWSGGADKFMRSPFASSSPEDMALLGRSAGSQGYRHQGRTNVAYCDGHAETVGDCFTTTSDPNKPAAQTGFLSADNSAYSLDGRP